MDSTPTWEGTEAVEQQSGQPQAAGPTWDSTYDPEEGPTPDQPSQEKYGTPEQMVKTGAEAVGRGALGPVIPYIEKKLGVDPKDILGRQEANPITNIAGEIAGFGGSLAAGAGLGPLLGAAGRSVAGLAGLGEATGIGAKLAAGAVTGATEMGLFQASDEATKAVLDAPNTIGQAASNIGLSAALGGAAGPFLAGAGMLLKKTVDNAFLKDFVDRYAFRKANPNPNEMIGHELSSAYDMYHSMGNDVWGNNGLKAQALQKLMPEMNDVIASQAPNISNSLESLATEMEKRPAKYGTRIPALIKEQIADFKTMTQDAKNPGQIFDAINDLKKEFDSSIPKNLTPDNDNFHAFKKLMESNGVIRKSLEDPEIWGKGIGTLQRDLNAAWSTAKPAVKDMESKFMTKVGGELVLDPAKLQTYTNQNGKATTATIRQKMVGDFTEGMEKFQKAVNDTYEKLGLENPNQPIGLSSLRDSLDKPSAGSKLADFWHDKLESGTLGDAAAIGVGEAVAPGIGGAYAGKTLLGPTFGAAIKSLLEKYPNVDSNAFQQILSMSKNMAEGNNKLIKASKGLFETGKVIPANLMPSDKEIEKLDKRAMGMNDNPEFMMKAAGNVGHYSPGHASSIGKGVGDTVAYINSQRPAPQKAAPLNEAPEVTPMQKSAFNRTLTIAEQPLVVLQHIKDGTIKVKDIQDLKAMYPEYYEKMSQQVLQSMTDRVQGGEMVPYHTRMGISLFLGVPMDSTMKPESIQAAQPQQKPPQQAQATQPKTGEKSKIGNKTNSMYQTANQEAEGDRSSRS